ncbi:MAG: MOSC domain-containing protein [Dehalococcoidia bacterium]
MTTDGPAGSVANLWRHPVKSMLGEELASARIGERGIAGDRAYALVDSATGDVASAKNPRKWPTMFQFRAVCLTEPNGAGGHTVAITLPDGSTVTSRDADANERLSAAVGRAVTLDASPARPPTLDEYWPDMEGLDHRDTVTNIPIARAAPGTFFDFSPIHIVTTSTLARLSELYPPGEFSTARFRPNILVETSGQTGFVENDWAGRTLAIGEVRLRVLIPSPRCVMTTLAQGDLPSDPGILRTIATHNRPMIPGAGREMPSVGVYAIVVAGGVVEVGDEVAITAP